ncbi:4-(cytidine 5'-diphospho)-2-C-methyl-D-erythritol kinase [Octadecabacter sp. 1_MG-2023]|uniref:4-(cytidine 5'-diphospho)-2-C-methyl-D-erythritol kinase n=1 Tax=unclassified Octadecabacter TaxID=196158 RepID=UPI001C094647|nr:MULTISPECIES: 4-(cytidine 5'-diphospho)-2-C-methyl-D-erythritol kinase [unclassified Octadecabacter]MBU2994144.1 4-(cytidine 5'-diphospho)-2-C-methyl-D-erythritol kinase [Octadecabacter sp. B2R22]MDO6734567.1 4-(cytidine 5'-diphospho)-2-C-methyl-D-erythritol kinase [Octadecabacter sp. 1_MG-2023]
MTTKTVRQAAPAKINLTLHVTGQRDDGYHLLDSLVMFTALGDVVTVTQSNRLTLSIDGPFGADLSANDDNLVLRAARAFGLDRGAAITLTKNLPLASGIGGGSADAAATLFALSHLWETPLPDWDTIMSLGADVGVCMSTELTRMSGIGDTVTLIGPTPPLYILLVNPRVEVPTPSVFKALPHKSNAPMPNDMPNSFDAGWLDWLTDQRNDLQAPAIQTAPVIADVLKILASQDGCRLARMSGSGATCFAIFKDAASCLAAAKALSAVQRDWWVQATTQAST